MAEQGYLLYVNGRSYAQAREDSLGACACCSRQCFEVVKKKNKKECPKNKWIPRIVGVALPRMQGYGSACITKNGGAIPRAINGPFDPLSLYWGNMRV